MSKDYPRSRKARRKIADREQEEHDRTLREVERLAKLSVADAQAWVRRHRHDTP